jgi:hypothetical protein
MDAGSFFIALTSNQTLGARNHYVTEPFLQQRPLLILEITFGKVELSFDGVFGLAPEIHEWKPIVQLEDFVSRSG